MVRIRARSLVDQLQVPSPCLRCAVVYLRCNAAPLLVAKADGAGWNHWQ